MRKEALSTLFASVRTGEGRGIMRVNSTTAKEGLRRQGGVTAGHAQEIDYKAFAYPSGRANHVTGKFCLAYPLYKPPSRE